MLRFGNFCGIVVEVREQLGGSALVVFWKGTPLWKGSRQVGADVEPRASIVDVADLRTLTGKPWPSLRDENRIQSSDKSHGSTSAQAQGKNSATA